MTRKQLEELGLSKEQIDSIMRINGDDIENAKTASSEEVKRLETENAGLKTQVADRDKQLEDIKKSAGDNEELKNQITVLQNENKSAKETHEAEMKQLKIDFAVEKALSGAKAKNVIAVRALLKDMDKAELAEDGTIKGLGDQITALQKSDPYLFEAKQARRMKGAVIGESGNEPGDKEVDFSKMSFDEIAAYYEENPNA